MFRRREVPFEAYVGNDDEAGQRFIDLLSGDEVLVPAELLESIGDGYTIAIAVMAVVVTASVPAAVRLVRTRDQALASAK